MTLLISPVKRSICAYKPTDPTRQWKRPALDIERRYWNGDAIYIGDWILNPGKVRYRWHNLVVALSILDAKFGYLTIQPKREHDGTWVGAALAAQADPCNRLVVRRGDGPIRYVDTADMQRLQDEIARKFGMRVPGCEFTAVIKTLGYNSRWNPSREEIHASWRARVENPK